MVQNILVVDDEAPIREVLSASLFDEGYHVDVASDGEMALRKMQDKVYDIVFLDIWMPGKLDGVEVLTQARQQMIPSEFVMISGHGTIETAVKSTKLGAYDFIEKPLSMDKIQIVLQNLSNYLLERSEKSALLNKLRKSIAIVGEAKSIVGLKQNISNLASTEAWACLAGETGAGRTLAAQNIHYMSRRASHPFIELHCETVSEDLLEGEIFGIEKGAMPGIDKVRKGKLELAEGGTLYLKEAQALPEKVRTALSEYRATKKFKRYGGSEKISGQACVVASVVKGFDFLGLPSVDVPSLRDHMEDLPSLLNYFGDAVVRQSGEPKKVFSEKAVQALSKYGWPGNIRELKNFVERIYILTPGEVVDLHDLRFAGLELNGDVTSGAHSEAADFREARARFEKEYLIKKIQEHGGNISRTAESIGLERSYLHRKIKAYGIEVNS